MTDEGEQLPWIVPDELWARIEPLLPVVPRRADHPGRKQLDDRKVLCGIRGQPVTGRGRRSLDRLGHHVHGRRRQLEP
ncbi:transposase [Lentzea indica]|uniref:transposase n=1 Tax=Lentzea indica TaxID=2604800 RepID=UPI001CB6EFD8|nr:transposase [Lentzea indica]